MPRNICDPPQHFITEPLRSFAPKKLENGDLRMAIAKAGQKAYSMRGDEKPLKQSDHCMDSLRYFIMTVPLKPVISYAYETLYVGTSYSSGSMRI